MVHMECEKDVCEIIRDSMEEDDSIFLDVGFMFDEQLSKAHKQFQFSYENEGHMQVIAVTVKCVDDEPGAVQSGHYVWPAAPALATFLTQNWSTLPHTGDVIELGAGCGLAGLVVAQIADKSETHCILLSDHDPGIVKILNSNIELQTQLSKVPVHAISLRWGPTGSEDIVAMQAILSTAADAPRLVIGTDVIYAKEVIPLLFYTVSKLIGRGGMFLMCSSFHYDTPMEAEINRCCREYSLHREIITCQLSSKGVRIQSFTHLQ